MVFMILSYSLTIIILYLIFYKKKTFYKPFPVLKISSNGISFYSFKRHRVNILNANVMQIANVVYLKQNGKMITIKNVCNIYRKDNYLYFTAKGKCEVCFSCSRLSKYFNIKITSNNFDITKTRRMALNSILNNLFSLNKAVELKRYLKILHESLRIKISTKQMVVSQNQFKLPFTVEYLANRTHKKISFNSET